MTRNEFVTRALEIIDGVKEPRELAMNRKDGCLIERILPAVNGEYAGVKDLFGSSDCIYNPNDDYVSGRIDKATFRAAIAALAEP